MKGKNPKSRGGNKNSKEMPGSTKVHHHQPYVGAAGRTSSRPVSTMKPGLCEILSQKKEEEELGGEVEGSRKRRNFEWLSDYLTNDSFDTCITQAHTLSFS